MNSLLENERRRATAHLLRPILEEANYHPALEEKMNSSLEALPEQSSVDRTQDVIIAALVQWMKDRRPK